MIRARRVAVIAGGHAAHDTYTAFLAPLLPLFIAGLALSRTEAGLLAVFLQLPWLLQPWIGHWADRSRAGTAVVVWAPALAGVTMSLLGVAPGYGALVALLLVCGLGSAAFHAVGPALVGALSGRDVGRGMGIWMVGGELGRTLGPVVAVSAVSWLGQGRFPWLMLGGLAASLILRRQLRAVGTSPSAAAAARDRPWRRVLRAMAPLLLPLAGIMLLRAFLVAALNLYLPVYLDEAGEALWLAGAALSLLEGAGVAGALLGGTLSDRLGRRTVLAVALTGAPLCLLAFLAADGWLRLPLLILLGVTGLSVSPVIMALVLESFPENRALANGVYMVTSYTIRSAAVIGMGVASDAFGLRQAYAASAAVALLALPLLRLLPAGGGRDGAEASGRAP